MEDLRLRFDQSSPEGAYNLELAKTDDEDAARRAMTKFEVALAHARAKDVVIR